MMNRWADYLDDLRAKPALFYRNNQIKKRKVIDHARSKTAMRILRLPQVLEIFSHQQKLMVEGCKEDRFPKPIKLGPRTTVWRKIRHRKAGGRSVQGRGNKGRKMFDLGGHCREQWPCQVL